jgi:hypothetical protein
MKIWEQMDLIYWEHHAPLETRTLLWTPWDIYLNKNMHQHKVQHLRGTKALVQSWLHKSSMFRPFTLRRKIWFFPTHII